LGYFSKPSQKRSNLFDKIERGDYMIKKYDKLVRDKIIDIIQADGKKVEYEIMDKEEHLDYLNQKLLEELDEYLESKNIEELADLVEVVYGILYLKSIDIEEFEDIRESKKKEKGGFERGIKLLEVEG